MPRTSAQLIEAAAAALYRTFTFITPNESSTSEGVWEDLSPDEQEQYRAATRQSLDTAHVDLVDDPDEGGQLVGTSREQRLRRRRLEEARTRRAEALQKIEEAARLSFATYVTELLQPYVPAAIVASAAIAERLDKAARALYQSISLEPADPWEALTETVRDTYRALARTTLAAAGVDLLDDPDEGGQRPRLVACKTFSDVEALAGSLTLVRIGEENVRIEDAFLNDDGSVEVSIVPVTDPARAPRVLERVQIGDVYQIVT